MNTKSYCSFCSKLCGYNDWSKYHKYGFCIENRPLLYVSITPKKEKTLIECLRIFYYSAIIFFRKYRII